MCTLLALLLVLICVSHTLFVCVLHTLFVCIACTLCMDLAHLCHALNLYVCQSDVYLAVCTLLVLFLVPICVSRTLFVCVSI